MNPGFNDMHHDAVMNAIVLNNKPLELSALGNHIDQRPDPHLSADGFSTENSSQEDEVNVPPPSTTPSTATSQKTGHPASATNESWGAPSQPLFQREGDFMSHDTSGVKPRPTEVVAVETVRGLMAQVLELLDHSSDPMAWEAIEAKFDEAAHAANVTGEVLRYRQERIPQAKACRVIVIPTEAQGPRIADFLRQAMLRGVAGGGK